MAVGHGFMEDGYDMSITKCFFKYWEFGKFYINSCMPYKSKTKPLGLHSPQDTPRRKPQNTSKFLEQQS